MLAWIGLFGSPAVLLVCLVLGIDLPSLVAYALVAGFVGGWLTGWAAYSARVREAFGGEGRIAGFMFIGTPTRPLDERPRPTPDAVIARWQPPADEAAQAG